MRIMVGVSSREIWMAVGGYMDGGTLLLFTEDLNLLFFILFYFFENEAAKDRMRKRGVLTQVGPQPAHLSHVRHSDSTQLPDCTQLGIVHGLHIHTQDDTEIDVIASTFTQAPHFQHQ